MEFVELDSETFRKFADKSPYKSFMQTPEIAQYRAQGGWTAYYFGAKKNHRLVAATMVVAKPTFLGKSTFYAPGGPLLDYEDLELTRFFFKKLTAYIRSHNGYVLHIDPYYEVIERNRSGRPVEDGFDHRQALVTFKSLGFRPIAESTQPKYLFVMNLQHRTPEQIFAEMKQNTRNLVHRAERAGVKVRELKKDELGLFKRITESTSNRRNFNDMPLKYYEQMYDIFHKRGEVKFMLAEVTPVTDPDSSNPAQATSESNGSAQAASKPSASKPKSASARTTPVSTTPPPTTPIPLSVAMFMTYGDEVIYLFSGSDERYMKQYNAQYLIQWHMIKYAAEHKYKTYNFYGINGLPDPSAKDYGIYVFKKGFDTKHGRVVELIGSYELPISPAFYHLHHALSKLKHLKK